MELPDKIFGMPVRVLETASLAGYPLLYTSAYRWQKAEIGGVGCLVAEALDAVKPLQVSKVFAEVQEREGVPCLLANSGLAAYQRAKLSGYGVAWISSTDTFHIPFLGASCARPKAAETTPKRLSAGAQRIAANLICGRWAERTTTELAGLMGMSLSSISSFLAEIAAADPSLVGSRGRTRFLTKLESEEARREAFERLLPYLASPVRERRLLALDDDGLEAFRNLPLSGPSLLSAKTMIADDPWETRAVCFRDKTALKSIMAHSEQVTRYDEPDACLEVWSYDPGGEADPVSLWLSLSELANESDDERLEAAFDEYGEAMLR